MTASKTKEYKSRVKLTRHQAEALHGLMLGDLHASRSAPTHNTRLQFNQGDVHKEYAEHLYQLFLPLINQEIYITKREPDVRTGKIYVSFVFKTLAFSFLNLYSELYYTPSYGSGVRVLPANLADYFTDISLAY